MYMYTLVVRGINKNTCTLVSTSSQSSGIMGSSLRGRRASNSSSLALEKKLIGGNTTYKETW